MRCVLGTQYFTRDQTALGYAKCAERVLGENVDFLTKNPETMPIFIALLYQSLEISIKHVGIESQLFTEKESRRTGLGHEIEALANLANDKLEAINKPPIIIDALTDELDRLTQEIIDAMIFNKRLELTKKLYSNRNLIYGEIEDRELGYIDNMKPWAEAVKKVATNLGRAIEKIEKFKNS